MKVRWPRFVNRSPPAVTKFVVCKIAVDPQCDLGNIFFSCVSFEYLVLSCTQLSRWFRCYIKNYYKSNYWRRRELRGGFQDFDVNKAKFGTRCSPPQPPSPQIQGCILILLKNIFHQTKISSYNSLHMLVKRGLSYRVSDFYHKPFPHTCPEKRIVGINLKWRASNLF